MATDYSKGLIYKIVCKDPDVKSLYVGSTCNFRDRKHSHKVETAKRKTNMKLYKCIDENGGWINWDMILIEYYPCETKKELLRQERHWIEELKADLNNNIPSRTPKEWNDENRDKVREIDKRCYENNREKRLEKARKYREENREIIRERNKKYYEQNKEKIATRVKSYSEKNKESIIDRKRVYYENNKDSLNAHKKERITCLCGSTFARGGKSQHEKSNKHVRFVNSSTEGKYFSN